MAPPALVLLHTLAVLSTLRTASTLSDTSSSSRSRRTANASNRNDLLHNNPNPIHTLLLTRHGDSIWNGGHPGQPETFTGWTDVPLSPRGQTEALRTAATLSAHYPFGIDCCFTSALSRAALTAHECLWAYGDLPESVGVGKFVADYRLNERHYGSLQGYVKSDVERGLYGHEPHLVESWRRSWHAVPPLLEHDDVRRVEEVRRYGHLCGGEENVPRGESLEMVAKDRIRPFLEEVLTPALEGAVAERRRRRRWNDHEHEHEHEHEGGEYEEEEGGTGLVVAHANSLRALIGVLCDVERDEAALARVERMKIQTGVPLVLRYRRRTRTCSNNDVGVDCDGSRRINGAGGMYEVCNDLPGMDGGGESSSSYSSSPPELSVWPLASIPWSAGRTRASSSAETLSERSREESPSIEFDVL